MTPMRRALITACALTGTTEAVAGRTGARWFLPEVMVSRFAGPAGIDADVFGAHLDRVRSFEDTRWTGYWNALADARLADAHGVLAPLAGPALPGPEVLFAPEGESALSALFGPVARHVADRGPAPGASPRPPADDNPPDADGHGDGADAARRDALDAVVEAIVYRTFAAWPGAGSPARRRAYLDARALFETLLVALAPWLGIDVEIVRVAAGADTVRAVTIFPRGTARCPAVLVTNGLDGTVQELVLPLLRYRDRGMGLVVMEMPGSNLAGAPMSAESTATYRAVLDHLAAHPRVDGGRIAMFGMSFGGYWAVRTAAADGRVRCAVCCGTPTHRGFGPRAAFGVAAPMLRAMRSALGARGLPDIGRKLARLSLRGRYRDLAVPLLIVDGELDSVVDVRDSRELAAAVPDSVLRLYPGDDHCAPGHYAEWLDEAMSWLAARLSVTG